MAAPRRPLRLQRPAARCGPCRDASPRPHRPPVFGSIAAPRANPHLGPLAGWERRAGVLHAWAMSDDIRAGFCAIVGLPNVGKSTLLNRILDRHLVAVSAKPQTTRDRIVGVHTVTLDGDGEPIPAQIAYVDTPGVQDGRGPLRRYMRDAAIAAAADADVVLLVVDATDRRGRTPERLAEPDSAALGAASRAHP